MNRRQLTIAACVAALAAGCAEEVSFPEPESGPTAGLTSADLGRRYDLDGDGKPDFFTYPDASGRVTRLGYDRDADGTPEETIDLDALGPGEFRHLVIILDGFGYRVVREFYDEGRLRMFHRPSRLIAPYPTMTDPALVDALGLPTSSGFEAKYYSHDRDEVVGGKMAYLSGTGAPYNRVLDYRAALLWDAIGYAKPWYVFGRELPNLRKDFRKSRKPEFLAYVVSTAGVSTLGGADGQRRALKRLEQLVHRLVYENRGRVKVTMLSDHGHSYTPAERAPIAEDLAEGGWNVTSKLESPKDVVYIRFGLVTYATFYTHSPARLAADLSDCTGVTLVSYADGDAVVVLDSDGGRARITRRGNRYGYERIAGDPLDLDAVLATLESDGRGMYDADALLAATGQHRRPAPLQRLWRAHHGLVKHPGDVIVSLADEYFSGAGGFAGAVDIASTHGSLNRVNSTAFIMSMVAPLPELMRSRGVPEAMSNALARPFPTNRNDAAK